LKIQQPIFIVGSGRSGTTLFYNILAGHKDLTWFSNYTNYFPKQLWLSKLNYLYKNIKLAKEFRNRSIFPKPSEGFNLWNFFHPVGKLEARGAARPLYESDVKEANISLMKDTIVKHMQHSECSRFINKNIRNTRRSRYLYKIFPDGLFIHMIRDGRAVSNSLLNVNWWRDLPLWYREDKKTPAQLIIEGENEILLAAKMWKNEIQTMFRDSNKIPKHQFFEVKYEELIKNPILTLKNVLNFCNLEYSERFEKYIDSFNIESMDYKWKKNFTENQISLIESELNSLLKQLGYN